MSKKDSGGKYLIDRDPTGWVRWLLDNPTLIVSKVLSTEFQFVTRRSDSLLQVETKSGTFLVLVELQLHHDPDMPARLQNYGAMARQKYGLPVFIIVIYLIEPSPGITIADCYHSEFMGQVAHQDFMAVKMWELDAWQMLQKPIPTGLLPYVPLMDRADEDVLRECARRIRQEPDHEELETILALFAMIKLDAKVVEQIVRWHVTLLEKSPIYQEILTKGIQQGLEKGLQKGLEKGLQKGLEQGRERELRRSILHVLERRFGIIQPQSDLPDALDEIGLPQLETLFDDALTAPEIAAFMLRLETVRHELQNGI